jgi:hypothetical protein
MNRLWSGEHASSQKKLRKLRRQAGQPARKVTACKKRCSESSTQKGKSSGVKKKEGPEDDCVLSPQAIREAGIGIVK